MEIALVAVIPLIILGTCVAMIAKINREKKENSLIWDWIDIAFEIVKHPRDVYKEPSALIVICANATMAYTTESGVRVVPVGCLRD